MLTILKCTIKSNVNPLFSHKKIQNVIRSRGYKSFLLIDVKSTLSRKKIVKEVIELSCLKVIPKGMRRTVTFHQYVKPTFNPELTDYCTKITGVTQEMLDNKNEFPEAFELFEMWMRKENLTVENTLCITFGSAPLGILMNLHCQMCGIPIPPQIKCWLDIYQLFQQTTGANEAVSKSQEIMFYLQLEHADSTHNGLDKCDDMFKVVKALAATGATFKPTTMLNPTIGHPFFVDYIPNVSRKSFN